MKMKPIKVDCVVTPPGLARIPVVDQAIELAKQMEAFCTPNEIARLLVSAASTWEMATTYVIKPVDNP